MLAAQTISDAALAEVIIDRVLSRLSHINPAIIVAAAKVILKFSLVLNNDKIVEAVCRKISSPLTSILNLSPEIAWTFMKNAEILVEKFPCLFPNVRVFFINFNDPCFIKFEKIKIMFRLCDNSNVKIIINELAEYSYDTNAELSRVAFQLLWKIGFKFENSTEAVITAMYTILLNSSDSGFNDHLLNEAVFGCDLIYRRFQVPSTLSNIVILIAGNYNRIMENDSRKALLSILPYFADVLKSTQDIITHFADSFLELDTEVQLAVLTATVRVFISEPVKYKEQVYSLLKSAAELIEVPDIRDRAFFYWRLLDISPVLASKIIKGRKDPIQDPNLTDLPKDIVDELFEKLGSISASLHDTKRLGLKGQSDDEIDEIRDKAQEIVRNQKEDEILDIDFKEEENFESNFIQSHNNNNPQKVPDSIFDMVFEGSPNPATQAKIPNNSNPMNLDLLAYNTNIINPVLTESRKEITQGTDKYSELDIKSLNINTTGNPNAQKLSTEPVVHKNEDLFSFDYMNMPKIEKTPKKEFEYGFKNKDADVLLSMNTIGEHGRNGVKVTGGFIRENQSLRLDLKIENFNDIPISFLEFDLAPNVFGLFLTEIYFEVTIEKGQAEHVAIPISLDLAAKTSDWRIDGNGSFHVEFKSSVDAFEFIVKSPLNNIFVKS